MIIQKVDKKKTYINIAILVVVFGLIIYLIIGNMFSSKKNTTTSNSVSGTAYINPVRLKYENIKKIDLSILDDDRYKNLRLVNNGFHPDLEKGNLQPFKSE